MNKNLKTIGIIVLLIAIGVTGWFLMSKNQKNTNKPTDIIKEVQKETKQNVIPEKSGIQKEQKNETISQNNQDIEELKVEDIDTSNWKTYRNEELGFEFKYPEDWRVEKIPNKTNTFLLNIKPLSKGSEESIRFVINVFKNDMATASSVDKWIKDNIKKSSNSHKIFKTKNNFNTFCFMENDDKMHVKSITCELKNSKLTILDNFGISNHDLYHKYSAIFYNVVESIK